MNTPFFATIMLTTGEEVLAEVMESEDYGQRILMLQDPIVVEGSIDTDANGNIVPVEIPRKWLRFNNDVVIVHMERVVTISEMDKYATRAYKKFLTQAKLKSPVKREESSQTHTGYLGTTSEFRETLERLYNESYDIPND